jgi:hypothetical protein
MMARQAVTGDDPIITKITEALYCLNEIDFSMAENLMHGEDEMWIQMVCKLGDSYLFATGPASTKGYVQPVISAHAEYLQCIFEQSVGSVTKISELVTHD